MKQLMENWRRFLNENTNAFYREMGYTREGSPEYYSFSDECRVRVIFDEYEDGVELSLIEVVGEQGCYGKGYASDVMRQVVEAADKTAVRLYLYAQPIGDMSASQLVQWYKKFGFQLEEGSDIEMYREPQQ